MKTTPSNRSPPLTVLIADPEADMRTYITRCLRTGLPATTKIAEAATGEEALTLAPGADLIITEQSLNTFDGTRFLAMLSADAALRHWPVLITTDQDLNRDAALALSNVAVLTKPFNARTLLAKATALLDTQKQRRNDNGYFGTQQRS